MPAYIPLPPYASVNSLALLLPILFSGIFSVQLDQKKKKKISTNEGFKNTPVALKVALLQ